MTHEQVMRLFKERGISRGGLTLFDCETAILFVRQASETGLVILGIDGFFLGERETRPSLADSIDLSNANLPRERQTKCAIEFLMQRRERGLYFEVVVDDGPPNREDQ